MKITVVMPSFNQSQYIEAAICSVISQDYPNFEFFVYDGGSTDGSIRIIKKYASQIDDWRSEPDGGQAAAINTGWRRGKGDVLAWLNSDDLYMPSAFKKVAEGFKKNPKIKILIGSCKSIDRTGKTIGIKTSKGLNFKAVLHGTSLPQPSVFIRRDVLDNVGYLNPDLKYALDWAFFLKVLYQCDKDEILHLPDILSNSREYPGTKSTTGFRNKGNERRSVLLASFHYGEFASLSTKQFFNSIAETYRVEFIDEFRSGKYSMAWDSLLKVFYYSPSVAIRHFYRVLDRMVRAGMLGVSR